MEEAARSPFAAWDTFYVIVGSSAAALTGLQFVVVALIADRSRARPTTIEGALAAFGTPTVVHFSVVLFASAVVTAPWPSIAAAACLGACGLGGLMYGFVVAGRARTQSAYQPVLEDWLFHVAFPLIAYAGLLAAGVLLAMDAPQAAASTLAAVVLALLYIGIHNAWDSATYVTLDEPRNQDDAPPT